MQSTFYYSAEIICYHCMLPVGLPGWRLPLDSLGCTITIESIGYEIIGQYWCDIRMFF